MATPEPVPVGDRELMDEFKTRLDGNRQLWEKAQEEIKRVGAVTGETQDALKASNARVDELGQRVAELGKEQGETREALRVLKQRSARPPGSDGVPAHLQTFGERFIASDGYKALQTASGKFKQQVVVPGRLLQRKAATTIDEGTSGFPIFPTRVGVFMAAPQLPLVMRDLLTVIPLSGTNAIEYVLETWTYAADYQMLEGDKKAQGGATYTDKTAIVRTLAWFVKVSRQMLADIPYVAQTIDSRLVYGVMKKEDHEILYGDGLTGHLLGLMTQAPPTPADILTGAVTQIDEILSAIAYLMNMGFAPTAVVVNPMQWANMTVAKNTMGGYVLGGPPESEAPPRLWGLPVVATPSMAANDYLVGQFPGNAALFDREAVTVDVSYENEDDFIRNLATFRAEERIALACFVPQAFARGPFRLPLIAGPGGTTFAGPPSREKTK